MTKPTKILLPLAVCSLLLAGSQVAGAAGNVNTTTKTVRVVMHDPGCHWFSVAGKFTTKLSVKGPIVLANFDEAALKVAGPNGIRRDAVGKHITITRGTYRITMVGQASDDNTLKLIVR